MRPAFAAIAIAAVLLAILGCGALWSLLGPGSSPTPDEDPHVAGAGLPAVAVFDATPQAFDGMPAAADGVETFSLATIDGTPAPAPALTDKQREAIEAMLEPIHDEGAQAAFALVDLDTGNGIACNVDQDIYGASTFKAPYAVYVCETAGEDGLSQGTRNLIEQAIVWSDNDSYRSLRSSHDGQAFNDWVGALGVDPQKTYWRFPTYSVRDSAKLWLHTHRYLESDDELARWLDGLMHETEVSFVREGVELVVEYAGESEADLVNKGGWSVDGGRFKAVNDGGIIESGGSTYLLTIMTDMNDSEPNEQMVSDLASVLYSLREVLNGGSPEETAQIEPFDVRHHKILISANDSMRDTLTHLRTLGLGLIESDQVHVEVAVAE